MTTHLFDLLSRKGLIQRDKVSASKIFKLPTGKILDAVAELRQTTEGTTDSRELLSSHTASLSLGGGRRYCNSLECRMNKGAELAQFALMYSDRVYVRSFFSDHLYSPGAGHVGGRELRHVFKDDLELLVLLRPAIEAGFIALYSPPDADCPQCLARDTFGRTVDSRITKAFKLLSKRFLNQVKARAFYLDGEYDTGFEGPGYLLGHRGGLTSSSLPPALAEMPRLRAKILRGELVSFSKASMAKLGLHQLLASEVIENIIFELLSTQALRTSFLTDQQLHVETLGTITGDSETAKRNRLALKHLTSEVPFLENVAVRDLVSLRREEAEAFLVYRQALNTAIAEYRQSLTFSERDARALYGDVIAPRLAALDGRIRSARKTLAREVTRTAIAWTGAISFGMFTGLIPPGLAPIAAGAGYTAAAAKFLKDVMSGSDSKELVRNDQMYFLWLVREKARKRARK